MPPDTVSVIFEAVLRANRSTGADKNKLHRKIHNSLQLDIHKHNKNNKLP